MNPESRSIFLVVPESINIFLVDLLLGQAYEYYILKPTEVKFSIYWDNLNILYISMNLYALNVGISHVSSIKKISHIQNNTLK